MVIGTKNNNNITVFKVYKDNFAVLKFCIIKIFQFTQALD